jgi:hypothetical protein
LVSLASPFCCCSTPSHSCVFYSSDAFIFFINTFLQGENSMCMNNLNYLIDAMDTVLTWDLPEALIPLAINDQAKLMAGFDAEALWDKNLD